MATAIENTLNRVGNAIQSLFNGKDEPAVPNTNANTGQTCLEITGMRQRELHLRQNTWRRNDIEYSKPLIDAEYNIQTEFKISSTDDLLQEQKEKQEEREAKAAAKKEAKRKKKEEKLKKKEEKAAGRQKDDKGNNIKPEQYENIKDFQNNRSNDDATFSNYGYEMA